MSVDTNTKNKNLAPYSRVRHPDYQILITPVLSGLASRMRITAKGRFVKNLVVEFSDERRSSAVVAVGVDRAVPLVVEFSDERHRPVYAHGDDC